MSLTKLAIPCLLALTLFGCTKKGDRDTSQELVKPLSDSEVILDYNGGKITAGDVREKMAPHFEQARESLLNEYVRSAKEVLFERNRDQKKIAESTLSETELEAYMKANHIPEAEKEKIRGFLAAEKQRLGEEEAKQALFTSLGVQNKLGAARFDVEATSNMPQFGPASAKATVQVFCDFANPMCNRTRLLMASTRTEFGDKIRWIYRFFPVASNAGGFEAAAAALCAQDQGQFWIAHDRLLDLGPTLAKADFAEVLGKIPNLDEKKLKSCMQSQDTKKRLDTEIKAATSLGLTSTPAYFVNGAKAEDAEQVTPMIRAALAH